MLGSAFGEICLSMLEMCENPQVEEEEHRRGDRIARAHRICEGRERDEREAHRILCELTASRNQGACNIPKIHI
jgi:hypothetical protein